MTAPSRPETLIATWRTLAAKINNGFNHHHQYERGVHQQLKACADELEAALTAGGWQPIETAPKDEKDMLMMEPEMGVIIGRWFNNGRGKRCWMNDHGVFCKPTHWMPLPSAPRA